MKVLLEMQYLGPLSYYMLLLRSEEICIEKYEHYVKGTFRNRCYIAGPNGKLRLTVPLAKGKNQHTIIRDVRIAYDYPWQKIHWQSLSSVYRSSPYFEFYEEQLAPFYHRRFGFLFDFNCQLMELIFGWLPYRGKVRFTEQYDAAPMEGVSDFRSAIHPKEKKMRPIPIPPLPRYRQVFEEQTGFLPDMSVVDILFNKGPKTLALLQGEEHDV